MVQPSAEKREGGSGAKAAAVVHGVISSLKRVGNLAASTTSTDLASKLEGAQMGGKDGSNNMIHFKLMSSERFVLHAHKSYLCT